MPHRKTNNTESSYYKQIVDLANVVIIKFDDKFRITEFAGNAEAVFGFKKQEVIGKNLYETIVPQHESTGRSLKNLLKEITENTHTYQYNINENITKDGRRIWMQWYNSEIRNEKNQREGTLSIGIDITDNINAEIALKESEERFRTLSDLTFEGIIIHDNGIILDCNLSFERQIGYTREELIGMQLFDKLIPPSYHTMMRRKLKMATAQYEAEAIHKNGTIIPVSIESRTTKIGNKLVRVAAVRNISELKKTIQELNDYKNQLEEIVKKRTEELNNKNEALQFERNQLRTIIDCIPDLIYIKDKDSRFLNANLRQIHHLGKTKLQEVIGKTDFDFYHKKYAEKYLSDEQKIIKTGRSIINTEELSVNELGKQIYLLTTKVPLKDSKGNIMGIVGIGRDISEKIRAEQELKEQARNLEKSNMLLAERAKKIETLNAELQKINKKLENANKDLHERKEELEKTLEQLKNAQMHLVQSEKMASLGILLAGIAHEINNPVNFIYAGVNSLIRDFNDLKTVIENIDALNKDSYNAAEMLSKIHDLKNEHEFKTAYEAITETLQDIKLGATRIKEIINSLNKFSKQETEQWKKANIHDEIENVLVLLKNKYKHHIEIIRQFNESLPWVECYPGKLNQVLMNILSNAIDAIGEKQGSITIKTDFSTDNVTISIRDTGKGIKDEDMPKIFDPFFTTKDVGQGLGLGLAISYSIIQEHKGKIQVKSVINEGTEFIISLPITQTENYIDK